jgi:drug/metabolite transporter (DMT)-like permease
MTGRIRLPSWFPALALGIAGVYLVVQGGTEGEAPPVAWAAATVGLIGMTIGTLYQKRFGGGVEWRTGFFMQYLAAAVLFALLAFAAFSQERVDVIVAAMAEAGLRAAEPLARMAVEETTYGKYEDKINEDNC